MRVLLLEPDSSGPSPIAAALAGAGYEIDRADAAAPAALAARLAPCAAAVFDGDTLPAQVASFLAAMRRHPESPRLLLIAHSLAQCVHFLDAGADDCIRTPLFTAELVSRVRRLRRLEQKLYGPDRDSCRSNAVQVHIHALRRKIDPALIRTIHGAGYALQALS